MKIISYNVNGIRSAISKGFVDWLKEANPDIIGLQEIKAMETQVDVTVFQDLGYELYWLPAQKKGYSGVAIFTKIKPKSASYGMGNSKYDDEGRFLQLNFDDFSFISSYFPSGTTGDIRQKFKYEFMEDIYSTIQELRKTYPKLIISGDYNICHKPIDIHNPISNKNSSGFLPEERAWMDKFINSGFIDSFRNFNPGAQQYTWWSYRFNCRSKNLGWRIDYQMVTESLKDRVKSSITLPHIIHSDHCPVQLELKP